MYLASLTPELDIVSLVILILFVASLLALAPLRKLRLPFTVAVMLVGFGLGQVVKHGHDPGDQGLLHELLEIVGEGGHIGPHLIIFVFLPALVFESAYNLEVRQVLKNLLPISVLAVPVLLLSTGITGAALMLGGGADYGLGWTSALLFGAMVSATDPVAVVALFKDLGAPKRLGLLVEGESLCNDGTAIVVFNILLGILVSSQHTSLGSHVLHGALQFLIVAGGGLLVGALLAWTIFALIGRILSRLTVEISLSVVLAYASFVIAEHFLHVSGVMATVAAGLVAGSYGQTKVSPGVTEFMRELWEYLAFVMNSLIFFFVGLVIALEADPGVFLHTLPLLAIALLAMIAARALGVFATVPLLKGFVEAIDRHYQAVIFWGGLRGAVSLALGLMVSVDERLPLQTRETILILAAGTVLFTLLVNALTMEPLIGWLRLSDPSLLDRFAMAYAEVERVQQRGQVLETMEREGGALPAVLERLRQEQGERAQRAHRELAAIRQQAGGDPAAARSMTALIALSAEKREVMRRFAEAELSEPATKALLHAGDLLIDRVRAGRDLPEERAVPVGGLLGPRLLEVLEPLPLLGALARRAWAGQLARDLEVSRGLYLAARTVERTLGKMLADGGADPGGPTQLVQARYADWKQRALERFRALAAQYPEYAQASQGVLAERHLLRVEAESVAHLAEAGLVTEKAARSLKEGLLSREQELVAEASTAAIELEPSALVRRVPCFAQANEAELRDVAARLISRTVPEGEVVVAEGTQGTSMYLIARGAALVTARDDHGRQVPLSTLAAGEAFGELSAILGGARRATVRALTPLNLLELTRRDLGQVLQESPALKEQVESSIHPRVAGRALLHCDELAPLPPDLRDELARCFVLEEHAAGVEVVQAGQPQRLLCLAEGIARSGSRLLSEGAVLGVGALHGAAAAEAVVALEPVRLLSLPPERLADFRERHAQALEACARLVPAQGALR